MLKTVENLEICELAGNVWLTVDFLNRTAANDGLHYITGMARHVIIMKIFVS